MNRTQMTLGGLLVLQALLIVAFRSPLAGGAASQAGPLLPALANLTAAKIELGKGDEHLHLVEQDGAWRVEEASGFPADSQKVEKLLADLRGLAAGRPVVTSGRYHEAFSVTDDEAEARVRVWGQGQDEPAADLLVGSASNYRTTHVRLAGAAPVYEVSGLAAYDIQPQASAWIDKRLVSVEPEQVERIRVVSAEDSFEAVRQDGAWRLTAPERLAGRAADATKVDSLVRAVTSLQLADVAGKTDGGEYGLAEPVLRIELGWKSAAGAMQQTSVEVGSPVAGETNQVYVTREGLGFAGKLWQSSLTELREQKPDALVAAAAPPPTSPAS